MVEPLPTNEGDGKSPTLYLDSLDKATKEDMRDLIDGIGILPGCKLIVCDFSDGEASPVAPRTTAVDEVLRMLDEYENAADDRKPKRPWYRDVMLALDNVTTRTDAIRISRHDVIKNYVAQMRELLEEPRTDARNATAKDLLESLRQRNKGALSKRRGKDQLCRLALRVLQKLGEYHGHGKDKYEMNREANFPTNS